MKRFPGQSRSSPDIPSGWKVETTGDEEEARRSDTEDLVKRRGLSVNGAVKSVCGARNVVSGREVHRDKAPRKRWTSRGSVLV